MAYNIVKCRFADNTADGKEKIVTEQYLVASLSCTEAEAIVTEDLAPLEVKSINHSNINNVVNADEAESFFLAKIAFISIDEVTAKESRTTANWLIGGTDFNDAYEMLLREFKGSVSDIEILSLTKTKITKFYPYKDDK